MHLFSFILFDVCQISFRRFWQILAIFAYFQGAITCFSNHDLDTFPVAKVGKGLCNISCDGIEWEKTVRPPFLIFSGYPKKRFYVDLSKKGLFSKNHTTLSTLHPMSLFVCIFKHRVRLKKQSIF